MTTNLKAADICSSSEIGKLAILQNGRVKPLYVHASEMIKYITGKSKINNLNSLEAYCRLSLSGLFPKLNMEVNPLVEHVAIKDILELKDGKVISATQIDENYRSELLMAMRKEVEGSSLQKSIQRLLGKIGRAHV